MKKKLQVGGSWKRQQVSFTPIIVFSWNPLTEQYTGSAALEGITLDFGKYDEHVWKHSFW